MEIVEILKKKGFVITAELGPPKGTKAESFLAQAQFLKKGIDAVNVTDQQSALMKLGSLAGCHLLKKEGIEPIMQITCRDRNRIALQSELLSAAVFGIQNILVLTGDPVHIGDHPEAKAVFDLDTLQLISVIKGLESGKDMTGHDLQGAPNFSIGAALNPCVEDLETEISKTKKKIEHGAEFFQTQGVFELNRFKRFMDRYKKEGFATPVLAGIIFIKSAKMAKFMNEKIPGIFIPQDMIARFEGTQDFKGGSAAVASMLVKELKPLVQGFHFMAIGWEDLIPQVLKNSNLI